MNNLLLFDVIYEDMPWRYKEYGMGKIPEEGEEWGHNKGKPHYNLMSDEELANLKIGSICNRDAVRISWVTFPKLVNALQVIGCEKQPNGKPIWTYKTVAFSWVKLNSNRYKNWLLELDDIPNYSLEETVDYMTWCGQGFYTRSNVELCLLHTKGKGLKVVDHAVRQLVTAPRMAHSAKPNEVRNRIVKLFGIGVHRAELFARKTNAPNNSWGTATGLEYDGRTIEEFIQFTTRRANGDF